MNKVKDFCVKHKGAILLIGGLAVGGSLAAIGYVKGVQNVTNLIKGTCVYAFDKPTALKDLITDSDSLDRICWQYAFTKDTLIEGISFWRTKR